MYRIGEFSSLKEISIKTLRYYDEINLLKPAIVDQFTGYRYYQEEQMKELDEINHYKELGFSLEEIKSLMNDKDKENIYQKKIAELSKEINEKERQLRIIEQIANRIPSIELRPYHEKYKIGKRMTLKKPEDYFKEIIKIKEEIDKYHIEVEDKVVCYFEVGYVDEDIDCFVGYTLKENQIPKEKGNLEVITNSKSEKQLIGHGKKVYQTYKDMIQYAHQHNIQIRGFVTAILREEEIEMYAEAYDLEEENKDYIYYLEHYQKDHPIDESLIGTYEIREILPDTKYMFNPNKQKSLLDTKYKTLELKNDGTTNYDTITWNGKYLLLQYKEKEIPLPIHKEKWDNAEYIIILMNESYEYYLSQRPMEYIYKKIKK